LDSSQTENNKFVLYDAGSRENEIDLVLQKLSENPPSMIVGMMGDSGIAKVARWSHQRSIPYISPFNPISVSTSIVINPGIEEHLHTMAKHALVDNPDAQMVLIGTSKPNDLERIEKLEGFLQAMDSKIKKPIRWMIDPSQETNPVLLKPIFSSNSKIKTVYLVPGFFKESSLVGLLFKLSSSRKNREVAVLGMPTWLKMESIEPSLWGDLKISIVTPNILMTENEWIKNSTNDYINEYKNFPDEHALRGMYLNQALSGMIGKTSGEIIEGLKNGNYPFRISKDPRGLFVLKFYMDSFEVSEY
jgi:hypothetical protein